MSEARETKKTINIAFRVTDEECAQIEKVALSPEIKGFSKEYLQESSPRREEVVREAEEMKKRVAKVRRKSCQIRPSSAVGPTEFPLVHRPS